MTPEYRHVYGKKWIKVEKEKGKDSNHFRQLYVKEGADYIPMICDKEKVIRHE